MTCSNCGSTFPIINNVPVFIENPYQVEIKPQDHESNQAPLHFIEEMSSLDGVVLQIGAGASETKPLNFIELEYSIFKNTDVVADAHRIPFKNDSFDSVLAFNVFEHLHNPFTVAQEIYRILKPGGKVIIHSAFLQALHEEPCHFYNATKYGLMNWFSYFNIQSCNVSGNFSPALALSWLSRNIIFWSATVFDKTKMKQLEGTTLEYWNDAWTDLDKRNDVCWDMLANLPLDIQERFSGGFELIAEKPVVTDGTSNSDSVKSGSSSTNKNVSGEEIENEILFNNTMITYKWRLFSKIEKIANIILPIGSKRRRFIKSIILNISR
jgi:SAM-dependent methyltransferase